MKRNPYGSHEIIDEGRAILYTDNPRTRIVEMSYDGHKFYIESTSYHHAVTEAIKALHQYKFVMYESVGLYPPVGERAVLICVDPPHNEQERGRRLDAYHNMRAHLRRVVFGAQAYEKAYGPIAPH
ncbi:hypothetical protein [Microbulbifer celer]|uniref:Uncharacterized protein n=1 Tax=Microbulbifer celer TaxID=435905 RepID=A0ABW3UBG0_9GAMM|nr:hypothetical protein [Microbulbifer celer]UFN57370.1 hypothetical protein LPW13_17660 [Microbulbifer celer]